MKDLERLQKEMQSFILNQDEKIADDIIAPENMPVIGRLNIYRNSYYIRLVETLMGDYPILCQLMGKSVFESMAHDYLDHHPSHDFSIRDVGKSLPDFLAEYKEVHPGFVELAAFEWAMNRAGIAADTFVFTLDALSKVAPEQWPQLSFVLHPSLHVLTCCYNSIACWEELQSGKDPLEMSDLKDPSTLIVWRQDQDIKYRELSAIEISLLTLLQSELNFSDICDGLLPHFDGEESAIQWLANTLQEWIRGGLFCQKTSS